MCLRRQRFRLNAQKQRLPVPLRIERECPSQYHVRGVITCDRRIEGVPQSHLRPDPHCGAKRRSRRDIGEVRHGDIARPVSRNRDPDVRVIVQKADFLFRCQKTSAQERFHGAQNHGTARDQ